VLARDNLFGLGFLFGAFRNDIWDPASLDLVDVFERGLGLPVAIIELVVE
jgi:hypothetical protein